MRSSIILSSIFESLPKDLNTETISATTTPYLYEYVIKHSSAFSPRQSCRKSGAVTWDQKYRTIN